MATNAVKVFIGMGEVLVFNVNGFGEKEYFDTSTAGNDGMVSDSDLRNYDDYAEHIMELPLVISNRDLNVETDRILT